MCGIAGFVSTVSNREHNYANTMRMAAALTHRGPDAGSVWIDEDVGVALAHRRLAVLDLSSAGRQPMHSVSGRWVIVYNGEIYNHLSLRAEIDATGRSPGWRGRSDTETLLAAIDVWGIEGALLRCVGMFAFALWDRRDRTLYLARDRAGEKPLYYGWQRETFFFGSELKALRAHSEFKPAIDRSSIALYLRSGYIPAPYSIYAGIRKLAPGSWLALKAGAESPETHCYWSLARVAERGVLDPFRGSEADAVEEVSRLLLKSVAVQQEADVPLGALLSGGIDSSLIASLMQAQKSGPVRTFTIGFEQNDYDETAHAHAIAAHLGTEHTELCLTASDALSLIPKLPVVYDEPFADSSQLPTCLVMALARRHVTVALSGDAGDELFGGYNRYRFLPSVWNWFGAMPKSIRERVFLLAGVAPRLIGSGLGVGQVALKLQKLQRLFDGSPTSSDDLYRAAVAEWHDADEAVVGASFPENLLDTPQFWPRIGDPVARMMAVDFLTYLPDDILVKVDRAAMAVSLETRAPFLDRDVIEFAWRLPLQMKVRGREGKWVLRQVLERYIPRELVDRPKMGFGIPLDDWLRGPLRQWASELLAPDRLKIEGFFVADRVSRMWASHLRGEGNFGHRIWAVLMFQAWLECHEGAN